MSNMYRRFMAVQALLGHPPGGTPGYQQRQPYAMSPQPLFPQEQFSSRNNGHNSELQKLVRQELRDQAYNDFYVNNGMTFKIRYSGLVSSKGNCVLDGPGRIVVDDSKYLTPNQWAYCLAHCMLHMVFGHLDRENIPMENGKFEQAIWNKACDIYVTRFLLDIKFGSPVCPDPAMEYKIKLNDERKIYAYLKYLGDDGSINPYGTNGNVPDMLGLDHPIVYKKGEHNRIAEDFAEALRRSVNSAVGTAGGHTWNAKSETPIKKAAEWFLAHYPLLGGLAASFKVIEDPDLCMKNQIHIAAVDPVQGEIYCNPTVDFISEEWRFVLALEYLHAGLMHHKAAHSTLMINLATP